jgi:uncharacterized small protein (DUF1192 family)
LLTTRLLANGIVDEEVAAMDLEDLEPRKQQPKPKDLESMGVEELEEYLAELESEAERVRQKIAAKKDYLSGAADLFKS